MTERRDAILDATTNPRLLAALRVGIGLAALLRGAGILMEAILQGTLDPARGAALALWLMLATSVIIGWRARIAALFLALLWFALLTVDTTLFYANHSYLIAVSLLLISWSDCELYYAIRPRGSDKPAGWPILLIRFQVSVVYGYAAIAKINEQFLAGDVLRYYISEAFVPFAASVAAGPPELLRLMSVVVIASELFVAFALWVEKLRPAAFALAVPLHVGMLVFAGPWLYFYGIIVFGLLMFVLLASFLRVPARGRVVVWDDSCTFCRRWVGWFKRLDALGALRFIGSSSPEAYEGTGVSRMAATEAMQLVEPDGHVRSGWSAVEGIVAVLPGGYLVAPYMSLPGIRQLGDRAYRRVAASRTCAYIPAGNARSG